VNAAPADHRRVIGTACTISEGIQTCAGTPFGRGALLTTPPKPMDN